MRDIIFRGMTRKPGEKVRLDGAPVPGKWVYGGIFPGDGDFSVIYQKEPVEKFSVYTDTVGQYTGLCDENGTEIFEGDIVENSDDLYVVEWSENDAKFSLVEYGSVQADFDNFWGYELEVVGNIHENKELLEEQTWMK